MKHSTRVLIVSVAAVSIMCIALYIYHAYRVYKPGPGSAFPVVATPNAIAQPGRKDIAAPLEEQAMTPHDVYKLAQLYHYGRLGKSKDTSLAVQYYSVAYKRGCLEAAIGLARLYTEGDEAIHMKPDGLKAVNMYMAALDGQSTRSQAILEIGEIYANGLHPFYLPNKIVARQIYDVVLASNMFDQESKVACRERLLQSFDHVDPDTELSDNSVEHKALPSDIVFTLKHKFLPKRHTMLGGTMQQSSSLAPSIPSSTKPSASTVTDDDIMRNVVALQTLAQVPEQQVFSKQNVHSSTLQNIAKNNLEKYETGVGGGSATFEEAKSVFLDYILDNQDATDTDAVIQVLDSLGEQKHSKYDRSEQDIFRTVWAHINKPGTVPESKDNMIQSLSQSLASAVEHGYVVCSTGKITRILGSLDAIDPETTTMRPEWAINREIADAAAGVRTSYLAQAPQHERDAYDATNPSAEQKRLVDMASHKMQKVLLDKCEKDYVESGIMGKEQLDLKLQPYLSEL